MIPIFTGRKKSVDGVFVSELRGNLPQRAPLLAANETGIIHREASTMPKFIYACSGIVVRLLARHDASKPAPQSREVINKRIEAA